MDDSGPFGPLKSKEIKTSGSERSVAFKTKPRDPPPAPYRVHFQEASSLQRLDVTCHDPRALRPANGAPLGIMRLSEFIEQDMEAILTEWEAFAATLLPAAIVMNSDSLRDHAEQILRAVCKDLNTSQSEEQRELKSKGLGAALSQTRSTAAETHALLRARGGFSVNQMTSEYRALRASVLHLWAQACEPTDVVVPDLIRFNEAIDQAVAESVAFFNAQIERERNLLLGMLGHDMRSPLQVIQLTAQYLLNASAITDVASAAARLLKSSANLKALLDDLLDFNRTKLGLGITISPALVDLAEAFSAELDLLRAARPGRVIELHVNGDVRGIWDINRLNQLLGNLVVNAIKYGAANSPVRISLLGSPNEVSFGVHNHGPKIEHSMIGQIFEPLQRGEDTEFVSGSEGSLGLGLYIAREIAIAHHGNIDTRSDDNGTVFTVHLPRSGDPDHSTAV
jgi:signal transduction histidine kinase